MEERNHTKTEQVREKYKQPNFPLPLYLEKCELYWH